MSRDWERNEGVRMGFVVRSTVGFSGVEGFSSLYIYTVFFLLRKNGLELNAFTHINSLSV